MSDLKWSKEIPTKPGAYWYRASDDLAPEVVNVFRDRHGDLSVGLPWDNEESCFIENLHEVGESVRWAGPIPLPKEAE